MPSARLPKSLIIAGVALGDMNVAKTPIFMADLLGRSTILRIKRAGIETMRLLIRLAVALAFVAASAPALAQAWPAKPIRLVVAYPPGGVTDVVARLVAQPLSESLGQTVLVENKPGAAGMIGSETVASAAPDGYTLLMFVDGNTILPSIMKQMPYDSLKAFAPITVLGRGAHVIVVHPSLPVRSLPELIDY